MRRHHRCRCGTLGYSGHQKVRTRPTAVPASCNPPETSYPSHARPAPYASHPHMCGASIEQGVAELHQGALRDLVGRRYLAPVQADVAICWGRCTSQSHPVPPPVIASTPDHPGPPRTTPGHPRSPPVTPGHPRSPRVTPGDRPPRSPTSPPLVQTDHTWSAVSVFQWS